MRRFTTYAVLALFALGLAGTLQAQSATAQITGNVLDASGALIPGAKVALSNQNTGLTRSATTNSDGVYTFSLLPVGVYSVTVDQPGFKSTKRSDIQLSVDQVIRADFSLQIGETSESIEVMANAVVLNTENAEISQIVDQRQVNDLPLNGRSFLGLLFIGTGAVQTTGEQGQMRSGMGNAISINGARPTSNNYVLDGTSVTDTSLGTPAVMLSIDAIQEFKEQTSTYSAEYGFSANQINIVGKSGTNDLHGTAFWFHRNDAFDARSYFQGSIPMLRQNQFGFVAGGPVYLPKLYDGKNKTFFLTNYEGERIHQGIQFTTLVPLPSELAGQFSSTIIDPVTGKPFPNNLIPTNRFSRFANVAIANGYFPTPNGSFAGGNNLRVGLPSPTESNQQTYRVDQYMGRWGTLFGRWTYANYVATTAPPNGGIGTTGLANIFFNEKAKNWQVNHTIAFGANLVNVFRVGHLDATANQYGTAEPQDQVDKMGFKGLYANLPDIMRTWPSIQWGAGGYGTAGGAVNALTSSNQPMWDISDSININHGSHSISLGMNYRRWDLNRQLANNFLGNYNYAGNFTGNPVADFLLGYFAGAANFQPAAFSDPNVPGNPHTFQFAYFAPYVQDNWKVTSRLTLNLGLRWDYRTMPTEQLNHMGWLDVTNPKGGLCMADSSLAAKGILGDGSYYRDCGRTTPADASKVPFAPRVGFAWRPFGGDKTVVRGGYGIFYDSAEGREMDNSGDLYPYISRTGINQNVTTTPLLTTDQLFPPLTGFGPVKPSDNSFIAVIISEHPRNPYMQQWSLSVQRQLSKDTTLEVNYLGNKGTHLLQRRNIAQALPPTAAQVASGNISSVASRKPYPNFANYLNSDWSGYSSYNSANVKLEHRTSNLALTVAYTWAKSLDDKSAAAGIGNSAGNGWQGFLDNHDTRRDYGLSDFDVNHRFVSSFVYNIPFGKGQKYLGTSSRVADALVGGWQINGIVTFQNGFPFPIMAADSGGVLDSFGQNRANVVGDPSGGFTQSLNKWFNTAAFAQPAVGLFGNTGRNILRGPGLNNWDMSVFKNFTFTERLRAQLRFESFNTFNHAQWNTPGFNMTAPDFGQISRTQVPGRILQMGLKIIF